MTTVAEKKYNDLLAALNEAGDDAKSLREAVGKIKKLVNDFQTTVASIGENTKDLPADQKTQVLNVIGTQKTNAIQGIDTMNSVMQNVAEGLRTALKSNTLSDADRKDNTKALNLVEMLIAYLNAERDETLNGLKTLTGESTKTPPTTLKPSTPTKNGATTTLKPDILPPKPDVPPVKIVTPPKNDVSEPTKPWYASTAFIVGMIGAVLLIICVVIIAVVVVRASRQRREREQKEENKGLPASTSTTKKRDRDFF